MAETLSQPHQSATRRVRAASIALSHAGGATALHTAHHSPSDLTDLQADLSALTSASDRTPRFLFPSLDDNHVGVAGSFVSLPFGDSFPADSQYCLFSRTSNSLAYADIENAVVDVDSVNSHTTSQLDPELQTTAPWTHLSFGEGRTSPLSTSFGLNDFGKPQQLGVSVRHRANSSASGQESFRDSAYGTGSGKSQHEVESVNELPTEAMDRCSPLYPATFFHHDHVPEYSPLHPSRSAPEAATSNTALSDSGETTNTVQRTQRSQPLLCRECNYQAKTRSDLKKHNARHEREHRCHFPTCMRKSKGFATKNDLDRHLKSVHHINSRGTKYYKCLAEGCPRADRKWPRLDNFKQHLQKMHKDQDPDHLLELSESWYNQQQRLPQGQREDGAESIDFDIVLPSDSVTPTMAPQKQYENMCPSSDPSCDTSMTTDNPMARSLSFGNHLLDPDLVSGTTAGFPVPQHVHRRNISIPGDVSTSQKQFYMGDLTSPQIPMQRTHSQVDYPIYSNHMHQENLFDTMTNFQLSQSDPWAVHDRSIPLSNLNHFLYDAGRDQIRRVKAPHTVAVLDSDRMVDLTSPQEVLPVMSNDLGGRQDELLLNIGASTSNTTADTGGGLDTSPLQTFMVNVFPPENQPKIPETSMGKLLEDEINSFLLEHNSKADKDRVSMSQEEIINLVRMSLRSFSSATASGRVRSVGPSAAAPIFDTLTGNQCPDGEKTQFRCTVEGCNKVKSRQSDLRKHMARHDKPFGCTSDGCNKTFGSKNDWKRHEQNQHKQAECWLCVDCHEVFYYSQDNYLRHLHEVHPTYRFQDGHHNAKHFHIAANYEGHYWCGFCNKIMRQNKHGVEAVNARFNHIGDHFSKHKMAAKTWIELTGHGRRKEEAVQTPANHIQTDETPGEEAEIQTSNVTKLSDKIRLNLKQT
ncbi:hypothetical protein A1O1_05277 [Capronia coronata CBS 617.96]|uniref:C2H2-type domain-containing protein n=1 Tax=Capronia coronata CBS 617.96 TaxID=1182541 RepID=W9Y6A5_9EURO|nr:uncharacterized protein A1O1_05277 [Capronia coronata CBS 617.96]EXJ88347.1 hypothetical protein A1O1_05277 [Capronia coronata CBS 617.96]